MYLKKCKIILNNKKIINSKKIDKKNIYKQYIPHILSKKKYGFKSPNNKIYRKKNNFKSR